MLRENTVYHYFYRYLYRDGHTSRMSQPTIFRSTTDTLNRVAKIQVEVDYDLDNGTPTKYADIEVFRKTGGGDMEYLTTINPSDYTITGGTLVFVDDGLLSGGVTTPKETVSTESHITQTEVQDRKIKANVSYRDRTLNNYDQFTLTPVQGNEVIHEPLAPRSTVQLFARGIFDDGQQSFHKPVSDPVVVDGSFSALKLDPIAPIENVSVDDLSEINLYLNIQQTEVDSEDIPRVPFNSIELNNSNIPTLETAENDFQFYNSRPHILLGWKYFRRRFRLLNNTTDQYTFEVIDEVKDHGFNTRIGYKDETILTPYGEFIDEQTFSYFTFNLEEVTVTATSQYEAENKLFEQHIDAEIIQGQTIPYSLDIVANVGLWEGERIAYYKMSFIDALKNAVINNDVYFELTNTTVNDLSLPYSDSEYLGFREKIEYILDTGDELRPRTNYYGDDVNDYHKYVDTSDSRVYAVLPIDSIFNSIDNQNIQNTDVLGVYVSRTLAERTDYPEELYEMNETGGLIPTMGFDIVGVEYELTNDDTPRIHTFPKLSDTYNKYSGLTAQLFLVSDFDSEFLSDRLIYVGSYYNDSSFNNKVTDSVGNLKHTGFELMIDGSFRFIKLSEANTYENRLLKEDLNLQERSKPNQLVWSEKTTEGSSISGSRQFLYTSFLDISTQYGEIIHLTSVRNDLLVFCERGVGLIKVGQRMATNDEGDIYLQSAQFLSDPMWILQSVPYIQKYSIVEHENGIYFCDGRDVWRFSDGLENLTNGSIDINGQCVAGIDPYHKEYRLTIFENGQRTFIPVLTTTGGVTYSLSIEAGEWTGPHTYTSVANSQLSDMMFSFNQDGFVKQNEGNLYGSTPFETVVESVANIMGEPHRAKRFRKFFLDVDVDGELQTNDTEFSYASDYFETPFTVDLSKRRRIRGSYPLGIRADEGRPSVTNSYYWRIRSVQEGFLLRSLSFDYLWK